MIFLLFDLPADNPAGHTLASVWVDTDNETKAEELAIRELLAAGYDEVRLQEVMESTRADYFPPCPGLDAFERAEQDGFAINFS